MREALESETVNVSRPPAKFLRLYRPPRCRKHDSPREAIVNGKPHSRGD